MNILLLTLLCVYVHYNALGLNIKVFASYKNIFFMKVIKTEIRFKTGFQQPKTGFPRNPVLTSLVITKILRVALLLHPGLGLALPKCRQGIKNSPLQGHPVRVKHDE